MSAQINEAELATIRASLHKVAEFIANFENAEEKLKRREQALEQRVVVSEQRINQQLMQIKTVLGDFEQIMTEAGAARWRISADKSLKEGEEHLKNIRFATDEFVRKTEESYRKLDKASEYTVKGISKAIYSFRVDDFQKIANDSITEIKEACNESIRKVSAVIRWFHWRNIGLVLSITIVVTMISGLYVNDEWPWENHREVMQQRHLAEAVVVAWPHLSNADQQEILQSATKTIT